MTKTCEICGILSEAAIETDLGLMCPDCVDDHVNCENCGDLFNSDRMVCHDDSSYCTDCFEERISYCCGCEDSFRIESLDEAGYCSDCRHNCPNSAIRNWDYQPRYKFQGKPLPKKNMVFPPPKNTPKTYGETGPLYFGIELEIEFNGQSSDTLISAADNPYFFLKHDGSIGDGVEVVSHPASFKWINDNFSDTWRNVLKVRDSGMRSFKTETCGIHIHMSKKAFSKFHLYKFLRFFRENTAFVTKISQRNPARLDEWSTLSSDESILYQAKKGSTCERYVAVNLGPPDTVEIRIFRGNLLETAFRKNLEFCKALFDFTAVSSSSSLTAIHFHKFVVKNKKQFPNLLAFLSKLEIIKMKRVPTVNGIHRKFPSEKDRDDKWLIDGENSSKEWVREGVDPAEEVPDECAVEEIDAPEICEQYRLRTAVPFPMRGVPIRRADLVESPSVTGIPIVSAEPPEYTIPPTTHWRTYYENP